MTREEGAKAYQAKVVANNPQAEAYDFESAYRNGWADGVQEMQSALSYKFHEIWSAYDKVQKENIKNHCFSECVKQKMDTIAWAMRQIGNYGL